MAGVAQLVRASVCGTECRQFESGHPPHKSKNAPNGAVFYLSGQVRFELAKKPFDPQQKGGITPVHRSLNEDGFCKGAQSKFNLDEAIWSPARNLLHRQFIRHFNQILNVFYR